MISLRFNGMSGQVTITNQLSYRRLIGEVRHIFLIPLDVNVLMTWMRCNGEYVEVSSDLDIQEALREMDPDSREFFLRVEKKYTQHPRCNECRRIILGDRYKCSVRDMFYLCTSCEARGLQPYPMLHATPEQSLDGFVVRCPHPDIGMYELLSRCGALQVHQNVCCSVCGVSPIRGPRYVCLKRENFNMCQNCAPASSHQSPVLKIYSADQCAGEYLEVQSPYKDMRIISRGTDNGIQCSQCGSKQLEAYYTCTVRRGFLLCQACESSSIQPYDMIKRYLRMSAEHVVQALNVRDTFVDELCYTSGESDRSECEPCVIYSDCDDYQCVVRETLEDDDFVFI